MTIEILSSRNECARACNITVLHPLRFIKSSQQFFTNACKWSSRFLDWYVFIDSIIGFLDSIIGCRDVPRCIPCKQTSTSSNTCVVMCRVQLQLVLTVHPGKKKEGQPRAIACNFKPGLGACLAPGQPFFVRRVLILCAAPQLH